MSLAYSPAPRRDQTEKCCYIADATHWFALIGRNEELLRRTDVAERFRSPAAAAGDGLIPKNVTRRRGQVQRLVRLAGTSLGQPILDWDRGIDNNIPTIRRHGENSTIGRLHGPGIREAFRHVPRHHR